MPLRLSWLAVIGVFVLGLADDLGDGPTQATLNFDADIIENGAEGKLVLEISHQGGDSLDFVNDDYSLVVDGTTKIEDLGNDEGVNGDGLSSGERITIDYDEWEVAGQDDIEVTIRDNNANSVVDSGTVDFPENVA